MTDLPPGWEWATLGDIAESIKNGIYVSRPGATPNGVPILRINAVRSTELRLHEINYSGLGVERLQSKDALLEPGDLLFTRYSGSRDYVGVCAIIPENVSSLTYPDKLIRVRTDKEVEPKYIMFAFASPSLRSAVLASLRTTAGQVGISGTSLKAVSIPLAPLAEQRRVITTLERHLSIIDHGLAAVKTARRKASLFTTAALEEIFRSGDRGRTVRLGEILREPLRNGYSGRATANGDNVRVITLTAVTRNQFTDKNTKFCDPGKRDVSDLWLEPGDILIQRSNTPELVGTAALYTRESRWAIFPDLLIRIRVNNDALPDFVSATLATNRIREYFRSSAKGLAGSMPKIDQGTIERAILHLPPLDTQRGIVDQVYEIKRTTMKLISDLELAERRATRLRASLLDRAFSGGLVPQDPNDEPASVLLERIRAERAAKSARDTRPRGQAQTRRAYCDHGEP